MLQYYSKERQVFSEQFTKIVPSPRSESVRIIVKKLFKHYKLGFCNLNFTSGNRHSRAGGHYICINLSYPSYGVIAHEIAHNICSQKGNVGHNKMHWKEMKKVINYIKRKNYFEEELNRRTAPKPSKPEPTKDQVREKKIVQAEEKIKRYEKIVRLYSRKLSRAKRSLLMLKKHQQSSPLLISTNQVKKLPVGLWNHWRKCEYDDCELCSRFIEFRHEYNERHPEQIVETTMLDLIGRRD